MDKLLFGISILQFTACAAVLAPDAPADLVLRVVNQSPMTAADLAKAESDVDYILGRAGVHITWLHCVDGYVDWSDRDNPCSRVGGPTQFDLRIVINKPKVVDGNTIGFSVLPGPGDESHPYAAIYYPGAVKVAASRSTSLAQIAGAAISHELGHLLLGSKAHSPHSIMAGAWDIGQFQRINFRSLLFSDDEAARMRRVIARLEPPKPEMLIASAP